MEHNEVELVTIKRNKLTEEYKKAEEAYQRSIQEMQSIFQEELERRELEGPFKTEEELCEKLKELIEPCLRKRRVRKIGYKYNGILKEMAKHEG